MAKKKGKSKTRVKVGTSKAAAKHRKVLFVNAYIANGGNATDAAIKADYSAKSAHQRGAELVKDRTVVAKLEKRRAEAAKKSELTADEVVASLARDIRFDPANLYRADGSLKKISEIDADTRLCLRGAEIDEIKVGGEVVGYTSKVKFPEKTAAREQGMKHFGLYEKDNAQQTPPVVNITVAGIKPGRSR